MATSGHIENYHVSYPYGKIMELGKLLLLNLLFHLRNGGKLKYNFPLDIQDGGQRSYWKFQLRIYIYNFVFV